MSTPVMPVVPATEVSHEAREANAPEAGSERERRLRKARDEAFSEEGVPPPDIAGVSEQHRFAKSKR